MDFPDDHPDAEFIVYDESEYTEDKQPAHANRDAGEVHGVVQAALRAVGVDLFAGIPDWIVTPDEWGSAFPNRYSVLYRQRMPMPVTKLMVHHSASNQPVPAAESAFQRNLEAYGERRDGAACEYHYIIYPSGSVYGGFMDTRGCHSSQVDVSYAQRTLYNLSAIGICFIGNFYNTGLRVTPEAEAAFRRLVNWLVESGRCDGVVFERRDVNGGRGYYRHRDVFSTVCCADVELSFPQMFVREGQPTPNPGPGPAPLPEEEPMFYIVRVKNSSHIFLGLGATAPGGQLLIPYVTWLRDGGIVAAYQNTKTPEVTLGSDSLGNTTANFVPDHSLDGVFAHIDNYPS
jgi:hypothetical protein